MKSSEGTGAIEFCARAKELLLNPLAAPHFGNRAVLSGANTSKELNELLADLDPLLSAEMAAIEAAGPAAVVRAAAACIREYLADTPGEKPTGLDTEINDADLVWQYSAVHNGFNDLRQYCGSQLTRIDGYRGLLRRKPEPRFEQQLKQGFSGLYQVLRAVELLAAQGPAPAPAAPRADYIDQAQRQYLLSVAEKVKGINERIRDVILRLNIPLPNEIRSAAEEAIGNVRQMGAADRASRMVAFTDLIRREHDIPIGDAIHDRPELYQRTFGLVDAAISAWSESGKLPNPAEVRVAMEIGLIFVHYLYL